VPRQRFDISSKWLLHNQGRSALLLGGLEGVRRCEPMPGEVIQNRRYPDGLLQAFLGDDSKPHHVLVEIATYPERRALTQALDDLSLAYSALGHLPELLMLVLRPKGKFRIGGRHLIRSGLGMSWMEVGWRTVELWTLSAEQFLEEADVGMIPWVPLMRAGGPPEAMLHRCAERIEREAQPKDRMDLLVVSQVLAGLRFPSLDLLSFFGGQGAMWVESPLIQKVLAEHTHELILAIMKDRFETVPREVTKSLRAETDEKKLKRLVVLAAKCRSVDAFHKALLA
jgi:hypothetical protein